MTRTFKRMALTPELLEIGTERARHQPVYDYSHRKREANIVGCLGEVVFERFLAHFRVDFEDCRHETKFDYRVGRWKVDVKTKDRSVVPRMHFENSVPLYNHEHQRPDYYYFVSLRKDESVDEADPRRFTHAYLLGGIELKMLERHGKRWEAGQVDPANGTKFWTACINVKMDQLLSNRELLERFKAKV